MRRGGSSPLMRKGHATRSGLLEIAGQVFRETGYYGTSVSEICRRAGVSQGTFYQYFKNKEALLLELHDLILAGFSERFQMDRNGQADLPLAKAVAHLFAHIREHFFFHRILGEFELVETLTIGYHEALAHVLRLYFRDLIRKGAVFPLDPNLLAYGLLGMTYFHAMDWGGAPQDPEGLAGLMTDILRRGIGGPSPTMPSPGGGRLGQEGEPPVAGGEDDAPGQGQKTKRALLQAAEKVFGEVGYNRAAIAEITRHAGVAQGTFYVHFRSKRELLQAFVEHLSHEIRFTLRSATSRVMDTRDKEREGLRAFFGFLGGHRRIYRVVAESETLGQGIAMGYYRRLEEGYRQGLEEGMRRGEIRDMPARQLARSLMGWHHMIGLKWLVWNPSPAAVFPEDLQEEVLRIVLSGICVGER